MVTALTFHGVLLYTSSQYVLCRVLCSALYSFLEE